MGASQGQKERRSSATTTLSFSSLKVRSSQLRGKSCLKTTSRIISAAAIALLAGSFAVKVLAQTPDAPQKAADGAAPPPHHEEPAPTNLKVLPKSMTGEQVHDLMHKWEAELGTECSTCHAADPTKIGRNGKPRLNFADDSKKEKLAARLMVKMTDEINTQYVGMIENSGKPCRNLWHVPSRSFEAGGVCSATGT